jgi:Caudovirus prohead serine protease
MTMQIRQIPKLYARAHFVPETLDTEKRTVELTWSTGAQVRRMDWWTEKEWIEELSMEPGHVDLDRLNAGAPLLSSHAGHSLDNVLGVIERAWLEQGEGRALVRFSQRDDVESVLGDVKNGILRNISVGYSIRKLEKQEEMQDGMNVYRAVDWQPAEISIVAIPADIGAQIRDFNNERNNVMITEKETKKDAVEADKETVDKNVAAKNEGMRSNDNINGAADNEKSIAGALKAERLRVSEIKRFAKFAGSRIDQALVDDMIERGVSYADAKESMLKAWSDKIDSETSRSDTSVTTDEKDKFIDAGVNAIMGRAGIVKMDGGNQFRGMRLTEIAKMCLERSGVAPTGMDELSMVKRAFTQSTSDFPVLLENAMHKTLQDSYSVAADTWTRFCATGSVTDFRAHNRYRMGSFGNLDAVSENGEFTNKTVPDGEKATITADTKGNVINISRKMIINDDLSAFIGLAQMLGRSARRTIEADVYLLLESNPTMNDGIALFHASHGNLASAGSAVSVASVEAARIAMSKQLDVSGNDFLDLRPAIWVGGMAYGGDARVINDAQYDDDSSKNQNKPNRVRGLYRDIVDSPRITGNEWYTFADPGEAPVVEVAFLNGEQEPFLDSMEGFEVDGMQWKVRLDYGIAAVDYRGTYKNPGV